MLKRKIDMGSKPTRDPQEIVTDIKRRAGMLNRLWTSIRNSLRRKGTCTNQPTTNIRCTIILYIMRELQPQFSAKEVYKVMYKDFPQDWTDAVHKLEAEVLELRNCSEG